MHLERQTLLKVHVFIGIYFEEKADGLMKERRGKACYYNSSGCYCCVGCAYEKEKLLAGGFADSIVGMERKRTEPIYR